MPKKKVAPKKKVNVYKKVRKMTNDMGKQYGSLRARAADRAATAHNKKQKKPPRR